MIELSGNASVRKRKKEKKGDWRKSKKGIKIFNIQRRKAMGFWGSTLYANDETCDIRDTYMDILREEKDDNIAYEKTLEKFKEIIGDEYEPLFWYTLADSQWKLGRLLPEVKDKAMEWLDKDGGMELWSDSKNGGKGWKKTIEKLKAKLNSPMPKKKKIGDPVPIFKNFWEINDIYALQIYDDGVYSKFFEDSSDGDEFYGKYVILQKIGNDNGSPYIQIFSKLFDKLPTMEDVMKLNQNDLLPLDLTYGDYFNPENGDDRVGLCYLFELMKKKDYPSEYLTFIGNRKTVENTFYRRHLCDSSLINHISTAVILRIKQWRYIDYIYVGDGIYRLGKNRDYKHIGDGVYVPVKKDN